MQNASVIDIVFAVGLLTQFTKLADWILRPKQQEWVKSAFDSNALHLEYMKPLEWCRAFYSCFLQRILLLSLLLLLIWVVMNPQMSPVNGTIHDPITLELFIIKTSHIVSSADFPTENTFRLLCLVGFVFCTTLILCWLGIPIVEWMYGDGTFHSFVEGYTAFSFIAAIFLIVQMSVISYSAGPISSLLATPHALWVHIFIKGFIYLVLFALRGITGATVVIVYCATFTFLCAFLLLVISSCLLPIIRAVVWRIVEYNKGPWAALSLLMTVAIGLLDLYTRLLKVSG